MAEYGTAYTRELKIKMGKHSDESVQVSVRESVLNEALSITLKDRNASYGDPEDNFAEIAALWAAYLDGKDTDDLCATDVALMMVLMKVARLKHNPSHRDSWVDVAGYAACGAQTAVDPEPEPVRNWKNVGFTVAPGSMYYAPVGTPEPGQKFSAEWKSMDGSERMFMPNVVTSMYKSSVDASMQDNINAMKARIAQVQREVQDQWRTRPEWRATKES